MGGTAGRQGLFIQSDTVKGTTSLACSTFREFWPLSRELEFKITQIEIWAVDDEQTSVEQDVGKLISCTQYMKMKCDEMYNGTKTLEQPKNKQRDIPDPVIEDTSKVAEMAMPGPVRCDEECANTHQSKCGPNHDLGRVCCSKRCAKRIGLFLPPCGEGDANVKVHTAQRYPLQEEERRQCHRKYSEEKVKITSVSKCRRISFDARQKHGGFIHPSLAAEENARNAREAKEASAGSPTSIKSKSNKSRTSKKQRSPIERNFSQTSNLPTLTHNQTQVGESRLLKPTCRAYKHKNKCACVKGRSCACSPRETLLPLTKRSEETFSIQTKNESTSDNPRIAMKTCRNNRNHIQNEIACEATTKRNEFESQKITKTNHTISDIDRDSERSSVHRSSPTKDFLVESSSTVLIEEMNNNPHARNPAEVTSLFSSHLSEASTMKSKDPPRTEKERLLKKLEPTAAEASGIKSSLVKSETKQAACKHKRTEEVCEDKDKHENRSQNSNSQQVMAYSVNNLEENHKVSLQDLTQAEMDCHCSSSTDCNDDEVGLKKCGLASMCCCETKVSNYMKKMNQTEVTGIPLSEISSSVCSCILDNKNKFTATPTGISIVTSDKETQNLTKSSYRQRDRSTRSAPIPNTLTPNAGKSKNMSTRPPDSSIANKKETQLHTKTRRVSRTSISSMAHSNELLQPIPPTCLRCKTLVGQHGCGCKVKSVKNKEVASNPIQTSHLVQKELGKNPLPSRDGGIRRSVLIDTEGMSFISNSKMEPDTTSLSESVTSSRNSNRVGSQSSQMKQAPKKACKTSCKCSLSPSYFPVFPEDQIKEGGTVEDCDCASYNELRFPIIVETPPDPSPESSSVKSGITEEREQIDEPGEEGMKNKQCGCEDNDNTIIILNLSKCNTAETVEKIVQELEVKAGDTSNKKAKSQVFKCKDLARTLQYTTPCSTKGGAEREALRQHIEKILKRKSHVVAQPEQEEQSQDEK